ncbi:MAG: T9SS type A sorting domain-containing protein [Salinivirgaceae bacterium]
MKTKFTLCVVAVSLFTSFIVSAQVPARQGWWKFDNSADLLKAEIGSPLTVKGDLTPADGPTTGNLAIEIALGDYLIADHGIAPNGGGDSVNVYSLQFDILVPELELWHAIFQTYQNNDQDASMFINTTNFLGAWRYGYSADTNVIEADTWYRIVVSVENGVSYNVYVNGEKWVEGAPQEVDSRDGLGPTLLFFADNDGEDATIVCSEISIWDVALTAEQAVELGDPSTVGIFDNAKSETSSELGKNYPNPFSVNTTFPYQIKVAGEVVFHVFDITGKEVLASRKETKVPGNYDFELNGTSLTNGIYFVQMNTNNHTSTQRMTISH